jgi:Cu(I)/Ag(I) efflux system membrane fusion protein
MKAVQSLAITACMFLIAPLLQAQDIEWGPLRPGKLESDLRVPGHVIPQEGALSVESARVSGRITSILKREGEVVSAGDPLFTISSAECISLAEELRVAQSRKLQDLINGSLQREKQLGLSVSGEACQMLATHPGTLIKRQVELGASFNIGDTLATILDVSNLAVELEVSERDLASVQIGQSVAMEVASSPNRVLRSEVSHILPTIDTTTRTSRVRVAPVPLPSGTTLDALVFGRINVGSGQRTYEVPTTALVFSHNRQYVIKKASPPVAVRVEVLNETQSTSSILPSGSGALAPGDQIATIGAIYLYNEINPATP